MNAAAPFRDPAIARRLLDEIGRTMTRPWTIMEICGGQTYAILHHGLDQLLPPGLELVHGPGCPVCVTPIDFIDKAISLARRPDVIVTTFGDMMRVPGTAANLLSVKSEGADVRIVYSPLDALDLARHNRDKKIIFLAIGFETTAPNSALAVAQARKEDLANFSMLVSHMLVPPAMRVLLGSPMNQVQAFLAAGHVCAVTGWKPYQALAEEFRVPIVVTGFESVDLLRGILQVLRQLEAGAARVENAYERIVKPEGNRLALAQIEEVYEVCDRTWRGLGTLPQSGWRLRPDYAAYDADKIYTFDTSSSEENSECISGLILRGVKKPPQCPAFSVRCTPQHPLGAPMVSSEGACAAYYLHHNGVSHER